MEEYYRLQASIAQAKLLGFEMSELMHLHHTLMKYGYAPRDLRLFLEDVSKTELPKWRAAEMKLARMRHLREEIALRKSKELQAQGELSELEEELQKLERA